jgi:hypothetical protein
MPLPESPPPTSLAQTFMQGRKGRQYTIRGKVKHYMRKDVGQMNPIKRTIGRGLVICTIV